ncbi:hypothetical protein CTAM01_12840 [Colletotrichum tamarilloi]|uniref:Uncharacterized protein n=1 Tax=Colletotrichum tamarilloi TaxID=1209934 RepID=A0ABQ9QTU5_9PEZI|nr:uncharacterized protein CTAM01_12840 [Colletotrichum tamarilloi]KAK1484751.1 hypothetical protein CTAM01_12840 [Colletotrichum tamarilloi]
MPDSYCFPIDGWNPCHFKVKSSGWRYIEFCDGFFTLYPCFHVSKEIGLWSWWNL